MSYRHQSVVAFKVRPELLRTRKGDEEGAR